MPSLACGPFLFAALLGACAEESRPSAQENAQLDNAAEMLDSAPGTLANIDENSLSEPSSGTQPQQ